MWTRRALLRALLAIVAAALAPPLPAAAQRDTLVGRLRAVVAGADLGPDVGIAVVDVAAGRPVFQHHAGRPLNPASNQKLVTAAAALGTLGPSFTLRTAVLGAIEDGRVRELVLRGFGDPTLTRGQLYAMALEVADQGVRRVDRLVVDGTYFDDEVLPPAFEQQPDEVAAFRAPVAALSVDRNAYDLRIIPGAEVSAPCRVRLPGAAYFDVDQGATTGEPGALRVVADQRDAGERMSLRLRGTVPVDVRGVTYRRRVIHPLRFAGEVAREALAAAGIRVTDEVRVGAGPDGLPLLVTHRSPPLGAILPAMGKWSDNFTAEMLFKVLGAERSRPGRADVAALAVRAFLAERGLPIDRIDIVNGSGLFDGNRIAAQHLADLLAAVYRDPALRPTYVAHLAVGGVDGTLRRRLRDLPAPRIVRAKTGTLAGVIALSGYVLGPRLDRVYAFSILTNGVRGRHGAARRLADAIVTALAEHLHRG
ncbi:MAG: D-alanyl-D-alanine carboxypeptidase/D-alanyl-D-alanine-endopeptidase [Sandaracinaceae bacterium]